MSTTPPLELEPSSEMPLKRRSPVPFVVGAVVVIGGIAAGLIAADRKATAQKKASIDLAWSKLATCLVGQMSAGEKPSAHLRAVQLANAFDDRQVPDSERWPMICETHAANLVRVLNTERMAKPTGGDLAAAAAEIDKAIVAPDARLADLSKQVDELFAKAQEQGVAIVSNDVKAPAFAKPLLSFEDVKKAKPLSNRAIGPKAIAREIHRGRGLEFLVTDESIDGRTRLCMVDEAGTKAVCKKLSPVIDAVNGAPQLLSSRDAEIDPLVSFGDASSLGAYASDSGARVLDGEKFGWSWRRRDGHAITLSYRNEYDRKLRLAVDGKAPGAMLLPPGKVANENLYYAATLVPGFVLWRGLDDEGEAKLWAQPLSPDGAAGPVEEVGPVSGWYATGTTPQFRSCQSDRGAVAVVVQGKYGGHVTVEKDGHWTIPAPISYEAVKQDLACHAGTLTLTWTTESGVGQASCAHGICDEKKASLPTHKGTTRKVVDLDGTIAMLERLEPRAGYQLAIAKIDDLGKTKPTPLFDDLSHDPKIPWLQDVSFETLGSAALAILKTTEGTYFVRIDKDGKATPIDVTL